MKTLLRIALAILLLLSIYIGLLVYPNPLFAHQYSYKNFQVYSDHSIPKSIESVLDKANALLSKSELYQSDKTFRIYFCNDGWRFYFFTRNANAGGLVNFMLSSNVFIRESDIEANNIIPPNGWMFSQEDRPLSYFIAHEGTHSMQAWHKRFMQLSTPSYILEGYADYIGKALAFDFERFRSDYINDKPIMNPQKSYLYNKYHLYIAYLMDKKGYNFHQILQEQPDLEKTLAALKKE